MEAIAALLRGVNVVGHSRIRMEDLRRICAECGGGSPRTYLQSGNVLFRAKPAVASAIAGRLEDAIEAECGFRTVVMTRTLGQLRAITAAEPFGPPGKLDPSKLAVEFLSAAPDPGAVPKLQAYAKNGERVALCGSELYVYFASGIAKSKLTPAVIERILNARATARNWNTVNALIRLGEELL